MNLVWLVHAFDRLTSIGAVPIPPPTPHFGALVLCINPHGDSPYFKFLFALRDKLRMSSPDAPKQAETSLVVQYELVLKRHRELNRVAEP